MAFDQPAAARLADFVQFAYNMYALGGAMPTPDPGIAAAGYKLTFWLTAKDLQETAFYGYIAQSVADPGVQLLAIRGTENFSEWLLDFSSLPVPFHADASVGLVALGFQSIQQSFNFLDGTGVQSSFADVIARITYQAPVKTFTVLGHSLGAALATLAAAELACRNTVGIKTDVQVTTFASPRVGLENFADWFNKNVPNSLRIWNERDVVPQVPLPPFIHVEQNCELLQTQQQQATLCKTAACEHNLQNYQWLLDPAHYQATADCIIAPATDVVSSATRANGAQALAQNRTVSV